MARVRLIHWKADDAAERVDLLASLQHEVWSEPFDGRGLAAMRMRPPDATIIDLSRRPAQGRDLALALRLHSATRHVPIVFVDGDREKVDAIRQLLPDAIYSTWGGIGNAIRQGLDRPLEAPVVPTSMFAAHAGTPLVKKLGIKAGTVVTLVGAPPGFLQLVGRLPHGVTVRRQARGKCDLLIWFAKRRRDVETRIVKMGTLIGDGSLWVAWPKKTSRLVTDITQAAVRKIGLASGLVDYKVCSIDETWTRLKFTNRAPGAAEKEH